MEKELLYRIFRYEDENEIQYKVVNKFGVVVCRGDEKRVSEWLKKFLD